MYTGAMYTLGWLKQLTRTEEQKFNRSLEPMDSGEKETHHKPYDLLWTSSDLVFVAMSFQIDMIYLCDMGFMLKNDRNPGFLQIMIMYVTWGPALIYMEIFLGQYVRRGCLYLKNMSPLTCSSIGYAMLLTMYFYSVASVGRLADCYMFLFRSFSSELPWMVCPKGSTPATCIDRALLVECYLENKQDICYPKLGPDLLSSRIYYTSTTSNFVNKAGLLVLGWLTIYVALKRTLSDTRTLVKRLLLFILVLFLCLLGTLAAHVRRGLSIVPFFSLNKGSVLSLGTWVAAFQSFLREHSSVRGGWQLIGCHIKPGPVAANLTIYSCAMTYMITVFSHVFSTGLLGVLIFYMKVTHVEEELYFPKYTKLFNFYPFALGMLQVRQIWSLIFFTLVALVSIAYTVVNMAVLEETMYDEFPVLVRYRGYVKVILCVLGLLISAISNLLASENSYKDEVSLQIGYRLTTIIVLVLTLSVGYIYGMERFSDDMNFLNGSQPTTYWKICWKSLPIGIVILIGRDMIVTEFLHDDLAHLTSNIVYMILLSLAVIRLLYQIAMSIKARNVAGMLFQATPLWGPPIPEDRRLRNTYNPREETKYWRKSNLCSHHCLLNKDFILSIIFHEIDARTSKARKTDTCVSLQTTRKYEIYMACHKYLYHFHGRIYFMANFTTAQRFPILRLQPDFAAVPKQIQENQVVIAIDNVSSGQLETFEEQVKQKMKFLEQIKETEVKVDHKKTIVPGAEVTATKSTEELDYRIEQMIEQAERKAELEKGKNASRLQKTSSKTRQRQLPTFSPKETPRPKKIAKATPSAGPKDTTNKESPNAQNYRVQVPQFVLRPSKKIPRHPAPAKGVQKREDLEVSKSSPSQAMLCAESTPCKPLQRHSILKPRLVNRKPRLPAWPLPLDTPRPTIHPRPSRSSSSTSTESRELCCQPSDYFLNVRLPPKANLALPAFSIDIHSPSRDPRSSGSSTASSELFALNHDPVLQEILGSVHPQFRTPVHRNIPRDGSRTDVVDDYNRGTRTRQIFRPKPEPRTSIASRSRSVNSRSGSPRSPIPLPRKRESTDPPIPSPRPHQTEIKLAVYESASEEETSWFKVEKRITDPLAKRQEVRTEQRTQRAEEESAIDIDQAIKIRIDNLLRGVRSPSQNANQQPSCSSAVDRSKNVSEVLQESGKFSKLGDQGGESSQDLLHGLKPKKVSLVTAKISALGKRIAERMMRGSASPRISRTPKTTDEIEKRSEASVKEVLEEAIPDLVLDPEESSQSFRDKRERCDKEE